jgi:GTP-binding protein EngB required for normal cell division
MKDQSTSYQELELIIHKKSDKLAKSGFASKLNQIWNRIVKSMTTRNAITIDSLKGKSGNIYWTTQDSISGRRMFFGTEQEVRAWLDQRYYQ